MLLRVPAAVNLLFVVFCLECVQPHTRSLRSLNNKKEKTTSRNKQMKSTPISPSIVNGNIETNDFHTLQGFPDVIYPTSIYETSQPFYYKTGGYDDVLRPFSDDVKSTYKLLSSNNNKPVAKTPAINSQLKKDKKIIAPPKQETEKISSIVEKEDSESLQLSDIEENDITSNETITKDNILPKEPMFIDIIYNEGSPLESPSLELIPPYVPVRLKVNIEICKDDYTLPENLNLTEFAESEDFESVIATNNINATEELTYLDDLDKSVSNFSLLNEDKITVLDEINETDFISALSIFLFDSLNNNPIELPLVDLINTEVNLNSSLDSMLNVINSTNAMETCEDFENPNNDTVTENEKLGSEETNVLEESQKIDNIDSLEIFNTYGHILNEHKNNIIHISDQKPNNSFRKRKSNINVER